MAKIKRLSAMLSLLLLLAGSAFGQETTGTIEGTVKDQQDNVVPNVTVTVAGITSGFTRTVTTDGSGFFRVLQVPAGTYKVTTGETGGFAVSERNNVEVTLGTTTPVDITVQAAGLQASVQVTDTDSAAIDPTASRIQTNITARTIELLPKGTNFTSVLTVSPATRNEPAAGGFQIDGASGSENAYVIDGQEVTNFRTGTLNQTNNVPFQFVQEVQVKSSGFAAEYGGATGGVVNVVTKGGSNEFHGEVGLQFEPSSLFARQSRATTLNLTSPTVLSADTRNATYIQGRGDRFNNVYPSASLGGPILKNRLWFFASYSPQYLNTIRDFIFADGSALQYRNNIKREYGFARLDASPFSKLNLNATYTWNPTFQHGVIPTLTTLFGSTTSASAPVPEANRQLGGLIASNILNVSGTYTPTPSIVISVRAGRSYLNEKLDPVGNRYSYGIPNVTRYTCATQGNAGLPGVTPAGACSPGFSSPTTNDALLRDISIRNTFDGDVNWLVNSLAGRHVFKFGFQRNAISNDAAAGYVETGVLNFDFGATTIDRNGNTVGNGINGGIGIGQLLRIGTFGSASSSSLSLFGQDSWQPFNRLTLNLGLRVEKEDVPSFAPGLPGINFGWGDKVAPRLGFALDVTGNGKLKVFGSWGRFFDRFKYELPRGSFGGEIFLQDEFVITNPNINTYTFASALAGSVLQTDFRIASNLPNDFRVDPNLKAYRQTEITFGTEYLLSRDIVLAARFTHKNLDYGIEDIGYHDAAGNESYFIGNPGFGVCDRPACGAYDGVPATPKAVRKYDALEIRFEKRFSRNYYLNANYTRSRLFGNYAGLASSDEAARVGGIGRNSPNVNRLFDVPFQGFTLNGGEPDNGLLPTDRPHALKVYGAYTFDWFGNKSNMTELSGFTTALSGTPITSRARFAAVSSAILLGRGDLGRTEAFTQTDLALSHKIRFGNDGRLAIALDFNVLNAFNENNVLSHFENINALNTNPPDFGLVSYIDLDRAVFSRNLANDFLTKTTGNFRRDARYNQPNFFQTPRQVRFGFRFIF